MSLRIILAASAALAFAAPALAQDAPSAPPTAAAEAADPAEAALQARGEAFGARMEAMAGEMQAAITAAAGDQARASAALDAIVAQYQPEADAFADELKVFFDTKAASAPEAEKAELTTAATTVVPMIKGLPTMVRGQVETAASAAAGPAAGAAPAQ